MFAPAASHSYTFVRETYYSPGEFMSRSLNKATLIGNIGQDPEIRSTQNGGKVATFSLATTRTWNGPGGDRQEKTEWHRCVVWNTNSKGPGLADVVEKYVKKGEKLFVEGSIEYRQWQDKENQTRYTTEIKVRELILLGGKGGGGGDYDSDSAPSRSRSSAPARSSGSAAPAAGGGEFDDFPGALQDDDDDLPF
jgi:single-strand DNA-binding protein